MEVKTFEKLPDEARMIRTEVFMKEQGFKNEFDENDKISIHIVLFDSSSPIATCRVYYSEVRKCYVIGRIAVLKKYRGKNVGSELLKAAEREIVNRNGEAVELSAQVRAEGFYEKNGYVSSKEEYMDEECPHVWMRKNICLSPYM